MFLKLKTSIPVHFSIPVLRDFLANESVKASRSRVGDSIGLQIAPVEPL